MIENLMKSRDALDELRIWIKRQANPFSSLEPKLNIKDGIVVAVYVRRGDETIRLQKGDFDKKNNNSHF